MTFITASRQHTATHLVARWPCQSSSCSWADLLDKCWKPGQILDCIALPTAVRHCSETQPTNGQSSSEPRKRLVFIVWFLWWYVLCYVTQLSRVANIDQTLLHIVISVTVTVLYISYFLLFRLFNFKQLEGYWSFEREEGNVTRTKNRLQNATFHKLYLILFSYTLKKIDNLKWT